MGSSDSSNPAEVLEAAAPHASPQAFHDIIARAEQQADKETVLLDVRNHYETSIGHFQKVSCPMSVLACVHNLEVFSGAEIFTRSALQLPHASQGYTHEAGQAPARAEQSAQDLNSVWQEGVRLLNPCLRCFGDLTSWLDQHAAELAGRSVLMYCTGGVRCERASAYLRGKGPAFQDVVQLQGGRSSPETQAPRPLPG